MHRMYQILRMCVRCPTSMKVFVSLVCCVLVTSAEPNNVCSEINDYDIKSTSKNCWYNSDVILSVPDIILKYGYPLEVYEVTTQDGYILQLFRIPTGKGNSTNSSKNESRQPVLLIHGIAASSAPFVINGNESIGYILADEGYDVWIMNCRGSTYGKGHTKLSANDTRYWNFSFHEMGVYDLPKNLDFIYKTTRRKDIIVIGQSMGTNIQLVYASELPMHAKKRVKFMVYLAPTAFIQYIQSPLMKFIPIWPALYKYTRRAGIGEVLSHGQFPIDLTSRLCTESGVQLLTCQFLVFTAFGMDYDNLPPMCKTYSFERNTPIMYIQDGNEFNVINLRDDDTDKSHYPAGTSMKTIDHLIQDINSRKFVKYDYGIGLNLKYYQSFRPPEYRLSTISIPGYISYGLNDFIATKEGCVRLYQELPKNKNILYEVKDPRYNHVDFFFARNVVEQVIRPMLNVINSQKVTLVK